VAEALAAGDPDLAAALADRRGLHQVRFSTLAEGVTWFTITHRVGQRTALAWKRTLVERHGRPIRYGGEVHRAFPEDLLALPEDALLDVLRAPHRVDRLRSVLSGVAALGEDRLRAAPFGQARAALLAIHGVGPFTADAVLFRVLGRLGPIALDVPPAAVARYGDWIGYRSYYRRAHGLPH
jgi:DNA-3-methyladenine glycosylase II